MQPALRHEVDAQSTRTLLRGYLRMGARIGDLFAGNPEFATAELFPILPLVRVEARYARHGLAAA